MDCCDKCHGVRWFIRCGIGARLLANALGNLPATHPRPRNECGNGH
jgi:hypothetical protein